MSSSKVIRGVEGMLREGGMIRIRRYRESVLSRVKLGMMGVVGL